MSDQGQPIPLISSIPRSTNQTTLLFICARYMLRATLLGVQASIFHVDQHICIHEWLSTECQGLPRFVIPIGKRQRSA